MKDSPARRSKPRAIGPAIVRRLIQGLRRDLNAKIDNLRAEFLASETALAATRLRHLNERQTQEGVARLRADLRAFQEAGLIDRKGRRIRTVLPAEMADPASDVV